jgi:hypothetical protein
MKNIDDIIAELSPERQEHIAARTTELAAAHTPDVWVILEFSGTKVPKTYQRVLAGWYGGYGGSNSWKLSSGVTEIVDRGKCWEIFNDSGSIYVCVKKSERLSAMTSTIYQNMRADNCTEYMVNIVTLGTKHE